MNPTVHPSPAPGIAVRGHAGDAGGLRSFLLAAGAGRSETVLLGLAGLLMLASGLIHLPLWDIAYRHIATLGPLFLVQAAAAIVLAVVLATTRRGLFLVGALGLMAGTIVGFILVTTVGLFGFTLHDITGWADGAVATETGAIVVLLGAARLHLRTSAPHG